MLVIVCPKCDGPAERVGQGTLDRIKQLEAGMNHTQKVMEMQARHIDRLTLALRWIAAMAPDPEFGTPPTEVAVAVARNALEGKDG